MIDNVFVGSKPVVKGPIVTDWESYTSTITGSTTNPTGTTQAYYRRVGDSMHIQISSTLTTIGSGLYSWTIPNGFQIDTNKTPSAITSAVGSGLFYSVGDSSANARVLSVYVNTSTTIRLYTEGGIFASTFTGVSAGDVISLDFIIPILGWSSNVVLSDDAGNREIATSLNLASNYNISTALLEKVPFNTVTYDSSASYDSTNTRINIAESGSYDLSTSLFVSSLTDQDTVECRILVNGTAVASSQSKVSGTVITVGASTFVPNLKKGDYVEVNVRNSSAARGVINSTSSFSYFKVAKRPSPQTVAASEVVAVRATTVTPNAIGTSATIMLYDDKTYDTHNAYNPSTGKFTAPQTGYYQINASVRTASITLGTNQSILFQIVSDNATENRCLVPGNGAATAGYSAVLSTVVYLSKGQQLDVRAQSSVATTVNTTSAYSVLSIVKLNGVN
jgi:hypothetical protein